MSEKYLPLKVMRDTVARFVQDTGSYRATRIDDALNVAYQQAKDFTDWEELLRLEEVNVVVAASDQYVFLPQDTDHVMAVADPDNRIIADGIGGRLALLDLIGFLTTTGPLRQLIGAGTWAQSRLFTSSGVLTVVSDSASDTTQILRVRGYSTEDIIIQEDIQLNGLTGVAGTRTYRAELALISVGLADTDLVGRIALTQSANTGGRLSPSEHSIQHKVFRLLPRTDTAKTLVVIYEVEMPSLRDDNDIPMIPVSQFLIEMGKADIWRHQRKSTLADKHEQKARDHLERLISKRQMTTVRVHQAQVEGGSWARWSGRGRIISPPQRPD